MHSVEMETVSQILSQPGMKSAILYERGEIKMRVTSIRCLVFIVLFISGSAIAEDAKVLSDSRSLTPEMALKVSKAALESCRKAGYQVSVSVVDSAGVLQVVLRDQLAGFSTPEGAIRKARTAINFRTSTSILAESIASNPEAGEIRNLPGILVLAGGVVIQAGGSMVGAVGVAGAPGGELDEKCAKAGIDVIQETLDFL